MFAEGLRKVFRKKLLHEANEIGLKSGWEAAAQWLLSDAGQSRLLNQDVHDFLRHNINTEIQTEFLLTALRRELLFADNLLLQQPVIQDTLCTLIQQCLNNEYVWYVEPAERQYLAEITASVRTTPAADLAWPDIARLALYSRPNEFLAVTNASHDSLGQVKALPDFVRNFLERYFAEYAEEISLKESIENFGYISRTVSKMIAANYEQYPYPRWISMNIPEPEKRFERLREFFTESELDFLQQPFKVLVAGCGTGNKALEYALSYGANVQVLAVDLSRASLAYAKRMALRYQVENIKFLQADLLDLPMLGQEFHLVECTGVLHHLNDPVEGGRALVACVHPDGIIHLSLYSELARREIVRLRQGHEKDIPSITSDDVRRHRLHWMRDIPDVIDERLSLRWDFFDLNRCKDLLFHPLEHRFTVPQIARFLETLGLEFRGFEKPGLIRTQYWTNYPATKDQRNLSCWHDFELNNPDAFSNLYEIWTKKTHHSAASLH